jgi:hypothetical protein
MNILRLCGNICLIILLIAATGYSEEKFQASINFTIGFPQNEFKENIDRAGFGLSGCFLFKLPQTPLSLGVSVSWLEYGREEWEEPLDTIIPDVYVDVKTSNNILMCHFMLRIQPLKGKVRPYLDGLFGFNYLWTETAIYEQDGIYDQDGTDSDAIARTVHLSDFTISYGAGGGLMIHVLKRKKVKHPELFIDLGVRYLKGDMAEYMKKGSIYQENGEVWYDISESTTDLITAHFGVTFVF